MDLPSKYMLIAVEFSFGNIGLEFTILPLAPSIKTVCASLVNTKASSVVDSPTISFSELFILFSRVYGKVLTATEMMGDLELDKQSVIDNTDNKLVSSIATCNKVTVMSDKSCQAAYN